MRTCLFVLTWVPTGVGGVNEVVLNLASALALTSEMRPIIAVASWSPIPLPAQIRGIPVVGMQLHDGYEAGWTLTMKSLLRLPTDLRAIYKTLKHHEAYVVNFHFPSLAGGIFALLRRWTPYPAVFVLTFHGSDIRGAKAAGWIGRMAWRTLIRSADRVLTCARALATEVQTLVPRQKVTVIYNGVDFSNFMEVRRPNYSPCARRILSIGKFEWNKGHDVLIRAFTRLIEDGGDIELLLIGAQGAALDDVKNAAARASPRIRILLEVPHGDIPGYMAESDLFVLPSRAEGFPLVLLEASAAGLPIVATKIPGVSEFLRDGDNAILVEPNDPIALANAMQRLLSDSALAGSLASSAKEDAANLTWDRAAREFLAAVAY